MTVKEEIIMEIGKVLVGKERVVEKVLMAVYANGSVLLEDVPGVGKTTLALAFSRVLDLEYKRVQFTPDTMPSDITGFNIYQASKGTFEFQPGAAFCNLLLGDEINRTSPRTQAALLEAMAEKSVTVDGVTYPLPSPFFCIATQNPKGMTGTQPLPESQLDRFMACLHVGYPTANQQLSILKRREKYDLSSVKPVISREELLDIQEEVRRTRIVQEIMEYAIALCEATRLDELVEIGISPRGLIALTDMAKACARIRQRSFVIPEDIQEVFVEVCAHRLLLKPQAKIEGITEEDILKKILRRVGPPDRSVPYRKKRRR